MSDASSCTAALELRPQVGSSLLSLAESAMLHMAARSTFQTFAGRIEPTVRHLVPDCVSACIRSRPVMLSQLLPSHARYTDLSVAQPLIENKSFFYPQSSQSSHTLTLNQICNRMLLVFAHQDTMNATLLVLLLLIWVVSSAHAYSAWTTVGAEGIGTNA